VFQAFCLFHDATLLRSMLRQANSFPNLSKSHCGYFLTEHYAMKRIGGVDVYATYSLTSTLDGGEWSASRPGRFVPREIVSGTPWIRGWVGSRAGMDAVAKRKITYQESNLGRPIRSLPTILGYFCFSD